MSRLLKETEEIRWRLRMYRPPSPSDGESFGTNTVLRLKSV